MNEPASLQLFPNPAQSCVQLPHAAAEATQVQVLNTVGKMVRQQVVATGSAAEKLRLEALPKGLYVVRTLTADKVWQQKLIVE